MAFEAIQIALEANQPLIIWGPPGVGKTSIMGGLMRQREWHMETVIASIREPYKCARCGRNERR